MSSVIDYIQPTKYIVSTTKYKEEFQTPVLTAGQTFILGNTNETDGIFQASKNKPVIIFDDFTTSNHWVDFSFKVKSSALKILTPITDKIIFKFIYYYLQTTTNKNVDIGNHSRQWIQNFSNIQIPIPPLSQQQKIVDILDKFDALTTSLSEGIPAEIKLNHQQYEYYRNKLLTFERINNA